MIVTVEVLFSSNNLIGSKIIAKGTKHLASKLPDVSHVAILINGRWIHESTGSAGVRVISYDAWKKINTEKAKFKLEDQEYQIIADQYRKIKNKKYDYLGVLYLGIMLIPTFFGKKLPNKNLLQSTNRYFCCEVLGYLTNKCYSMHPPVRILSEFINKN